MCPTDHRARGSGRVRGFARIDVLAVSCKLFKKIRELRGQREMVTVLGETLFCFHRRIYCRPAEDGKPIWTTRASGLTPCRFEPGQDSRTLTCRRQVERAAGPRCPIRRCRPSFRQGQCIRLWPPASGLIGTRSNAGWCNRKPAWRSCPAVTPWRHRNRRRNSKPRARDNPVLLANLMQVGVVEIDVRLGIVHQRDQVDGVDLLDIWSGAG